MKLATVFLAALSVLGVLTASFFAPMRAADKKPAVEPKPAAEPTAKNTLATRITRLENDIGDVASLLHIFKAVSEVELRPGNPHTTLGVEIEVYKDGQKQRTDFIKNLPEVNVKSFADELPTTCAKVALLAADLDYLPLAKARKGHCRMQLNLSVGSNKALNKWIMHGFSSNDVPKELFDFNGTGGSGQFPRQAGSATETPLFYVYRFAGDSRPKQVGPPDTVSELIEWNPKGDVLIIYLRVRKK